MEIEINRRGCLPLLIIFVVIAASVIGYYISPRVGGRPVLLTTENYAIKRYLDRAEGWTEIMKQEQDRLASMASEQAFTPGQTPVPVAHPEDIYSRSDRIRDAQSHLEKIRREMERTKVPPSLEGLHALAVDAVEAQLGLANVVLDSVGAPGVVEPSEIMTRSQRAKELLNALQEALDAQRQAMEE